MLLGSTAMGSMNVAAKFVSTETNVTVMQMGVVRGFSMALGCWVHCLVSKIGMGIPAGSRILVFGRAFFGFLSSMLGFCGIFLMPLSLAVVLYFT